MTTRWLGGPCAPWTGGVPLHLHPNPTAQKHTLARLDALDARPSGIRIYKGTSGPSILNGPERDVIFSMTEQFGNHSSMVIGGRGQRWGRKLLNHRVHPQPAGLPSNLGKSMQRWRRRCFQATTVTHPHGPRGSGSQRSQSSHPVEQWGLRNAGKTFLPRGEEKESGAGGQTLAGGVG